MLRRLVFAFLIVVQLFLWAPILELAKMALSPSTYMASQHVESASLKWFAVVLSDLSWWRAFLISILLCLGIGLSAVLLGGLIAIGNRSARVQIRVAAILLMSVPFFIPPAVQVLALSVTYVDVIPDIMIFNLGLLAQALCVAFFFIYGAVVNIGARHENAALLLGRKGIGFELEVVVPACRDAFVVALFFSVFVVFDDVLYSLYFLSPEIKTVGRVIWEKIHNEASPWAAAASLLLTSIAGVAVIFSSRRLTAALLR